MNQNHSNRDNYIESYFNSCAGKIYYKIYGKDLTLPPLIIVHGGPGASLDYLEPLSALADTRPVILYDQLDSGNSEKSGDSNNWNVGYYVNELKEFISHLGYEQFHLLGQSWGAGLATKYLISHNHENVSSLILSAPLLSTPIWIKDQNKYISELPEDIKSVILKSEESGDYASQDYQDAMMVYYRKHLCILEEWPQCIMQTMEKLNVDLYNFMWGPSEFTVTGNLMDFDLSDELHQIKIPVLLTCGRFDEATPEAIGFFKDKFPNSKSHIFEDASHEHHLEKYDDYINLLRSFLISND